MALKNPHSLRHRKVRLNPSLQDYLFIETHSADSPLMQDPDRAYGDPHKDSSRYPDHSLVYVGAERIEKDGRKVVDFYYAAIGDNQDDYNFEIVNGEYLRRTYIIPRDKYYSRHEDEMVAAVAASGTLTLTGDVNNTGVVEIGGTDITYSYSSGVFGPPAITDCIWVDSLTRSNLTALEYCTSLAEFINNESPSVSGVVFLARYFNIDVSASLLGFPPLPSSPASIAVTYNTEGIQGNSVTTTDTLTLGSWAAATLEGGIEGVGVEGEFTYPDAGAASPDSRFPMYSFLDDTLIRSDTELDGMYVTVQRRFVRPQEVSYKYNDTFKKYIKITKEIIPPAEASVDTSEAGTVVEIQDGNHFHSVKITQELVLGDDGGDPPTAVTYPYEVDSLIGTQNYRFPPILDDVELIWAWAYADSAEARASYSEDYYFDYKITLPRTGPYDATIRRFITDKDNIAALKATYPLTHIPQPVKESIGIVGWWFRASSQGNATLATAKEIAIPATIHDEITVNLSFDTSGTISGTNGRGRTETLAKTNGYTEFAALTSARIDYRVRELGMGLYEVSLIELDVTNLYTQPAP